MKLPLIFEQRISFKNVKQGFGHDLAGSYADVIFNGKKVGYFCEVDSKVDLQLTPDALKTIEDMCVDNHVSKIMFESGWEHMESSANIAVETQVESILKYMIKL